MNSFFFDTPEWQEFENKQIKNSPLTSRLEPDELIRKTPEQKRLDELTAEWNQRQSMVLLKPVDESFEMNKKNTTCEGSTNND